MRVRRALGGVVVPAALCAALAACSSSHHAARSSVAAPASSSAVSAPASVSGSGSAARTPSAGRSSAPAVVPAPSPGNIHQTIAGRAIQTKAPVALTRVASFGTGISVRLVSATAITAKAHGPGEIGGPAVELTLRFANSGSRPVSLGSVVVNVYDSDKDPTSTIAGPPAHPVSGTLAAGHTAVGRYVFTIARGKRKPITISVSYSAAAPVVLIVGNAD